LLLGSAYALGAFRTTPGTPHLGLLPLGRALEALHPSQGTSSRCLTMSNLINLYETGNSCERQMECKNSGYDISISILL